MEEYISEHICYFKEFLSKYGYNTAVRCLSKLREVILTNRWENVRLEDIDLECQDIAEFGLRIQYGRLVFCVFFKEFIGTYKTNYITLEINQDTEIPYIPYFTSSCLKTLGKHITDEFPTCELSDYRPYMIEIKEHSEKAVDIFFRMCDIAVKNLKVGNIKGAIIYIEEKIEQPEIANMCTDAKLPVNILCLPQGVPIMITIGKYKGLKFAIDPTKEHNYLFYRRIVEDGIISLDGSSLFKRIVRNLKDSDDTKSSEMTDFIVSANLRFEGQKSRRKLLFEIKDGYEEYMEEAEKIACMRLHGVLGLPFLAKNLYILQLSSKLCDESVDGIIRNSWGRPNILDW